MKTNKKTIFGLLLIIIGVIMVFQAGQVNLPDRGERTSGLGLLVHVVFFLLGCFYF